MKNDIVPLSVHGHLVTQEFTPDGILVELRESKGAPLIRSWKTWEAGQEHGTAHAIELARHLKAGGKLGDFAPQVTQPKPEAKPEEVAGGEQHETEDDTGKGE